MSIIYGAADRTTKFIVGNDTGVRACNHLLRVGVSETRAKGNVCLPR